MLLETALRQALAEISTDLIFHSSAPAWAEVERAPRKIVMVMVGDAQSDFHLDFWIQGVQYGRGSATQFTDVVASAVAFLVELAPLNTMGSRFTWFEPNPGGVAHERGAQEFVSLAWSNLEKQVTSQDLPGELRLVPLIREAAKRPELRQLRPYTSLFSLGFSRTTGYPFPRDCPHAEPTGNNLYRVTSADGSLLFEGVDVVHTVDALVAALPPNCGPAINGTVEDS